MMSMEGRRGDGPMMMDAATFACAPGIRSRIRASAPTLIATLEGITRQDVDGLGLESQQQRRAAIKAGHFNKSLVPVHREDGSLALDREEYPRPQTTMEGLSRL